VDDGAIAAVDTVVLVQPRHPRQIAQHVDLIPLGHSGCRPLIATSFAQIFSLYTSFLHVSFQQQYFLTLQHSGQFLIGNGGMRVSALFHSGLANEESRVSALVRKSVRTIDPAS